ncbi:MAG: hypothetical protein AAFX46_21710, partial [Cyanobacteria bacterium J06636_27]
FYYRYRNVAVLTLYQAVGIDRIEKRFNSNDEGYLEMIRCHHRDKNGDKLRCLQKTILCLD